MLFLHLYCKKENFLPFTAWLFLSSVGILLTSNSGTRTYLIKQPQENNIVKTNILALQNKCDQLNVITTEIKNYNTLYRSCSA